MAVTNVRSTSAVDPYLSFKFLVSWAPKAGGKMTPAAYVSRVSALTRTTEVETWREGGAPQGPRRIPGQTSYNEITLERGVSLDNTFEQWANKIWYYPNTGKLGQEVSLGSATKGPADFRKDIKIDLMNQAGQIVLTYYAFSCWPSEFQALPELDASSNGVAIERLTLQNEGWSRDDGVKAPADVTFDQPSANAVTTFTPPT
jgi:phage tail-like protein